MAGRRLAIAYLVTLAYFVGSVTFAVSGPWALSWPVAFLLIGLPGVAIGLFSRSWATSGIPMSMWAVVAIGLVIVVGPTGDFGRVGLLTTLVMLYTPVVFLGFVIGKAVRYALQAVLQPRGGSRMPLRILK